MDARLFTWTLALAAPLICLYPYAALGGDENVTAVVTIVADDTALDGEADAAAVFVVDVAAEGDGEREVIVSVPHAEAPRKFLISKAGAGHGAIKCSTPDPNRGWLGVQLAEVSPGLAAHFESAEGGVMIHNVVKNSPAEEAGLKKFDIITSMNGESVTEGVGGLAKAIGALEPGAEMSLTVLRGGSEIAVNATLSTRPAPKKLEWIHDFAPETVVREICKARGKIISKDEDGNWHLEDLGDLHDLESLPDEIREVLPDANEIITKIFVDDDEHKSFNIVVVRGGETISIQQEEGGEIVVKRTDSDGNETEATYADAEALKAADEEVYELYDEAAGGAKIDIHVGRGNDKTIHLHGLDDRLDHFLDARKEWKTQMESAMKEARGAYEEAHKNMEKARKKMRFRFDTGSGHPFFSRFDDDLDEVFEIDLDRAGRSFRVNPDGEIEVIIRKGDTELTRVFRDEADLEQRDPDLYEKYTEITAED